MPASGRGSEPTGPASGRQRKASSGGGGLTIFLLFLLALAGAGAYIYWRQYLQPAKREAEKKPATAAPASGRVESRDDSAARRKAEELRKAAEAKAADDAAWNAASARTQAAGEDWAAVRQACDGYLGAYPRGLHAGDALRMREEAERKLEALRQAAKVAPKEPALDLRLPQLMAEGRKLLEKLDFSGAQAKFESAAKLPGPAKERDAAEQWGRKAQEFAIATAHIQASAYATAETSYRLVSHEGGEHIGLVLRETAGEVHFQRVPAENPATLGRAIVVIPKAELAAVFPVGLAERREELRRFLKRAEAGADLAGAAQAGDYYDLVFLSRRLDLGPECLQYLEWAYEKAPNGWLGQAFRQVVLDRAVQRAALLAAANNKYQAEKALAEMEAALKDYPPAREEAQRFRAEILSKLKPDHKTTISFKTRPVEYAQPKTPSKAPPQTASARELAAAAESAAVGEIVVNSTGVSGRNQAAARYVEEANRKFEEAMPFYQQFLRGLRGAQANQALDRAEKLFDASVDLYGKALEVDKSNRSVESRQVEASMLAYACRKAKSLR